LSGYGVHLVYVFAYQEAPAPQFEVVRERVLEDWHTVKREEFNQQFLRSLKERFEIIVEELPADRLLDGQIEAAQDSPAKAAS